VPTSYFAYGSNMAASVMDGWCRNHRCAGAARLDDFALRFLRRSRRWRAGAADVVPAPGGAVWGVLYEVSAADRHALDRKEFAGEGYRARAVEVELASGGRVPAVTYEVIDKAPDELVPTAEYLELLVRGARERELPADYIAWLVSLHDQFDVPPLDQARAERPRARAHR
jgi:cation transport regulator ChaC